MRVFARIDRFDRFVSLLVYVPRDRYNSACASASARCWPRPTKAASPRFIRYFTDGPLVRVQFIVGRYDGATPQVDVADLERAISRDRTYLGRPAGRRHRGAGPAYRHAAWRNTGRPSRPATRRRSPPSGRWKTSTASSGSGRSARRHRLLSRARRSRASLPRCRLSLRRDRSPCRSACRSWRTSASRPSTSAPITSARVFADGMREVTLHDMVLETADGAPIDLGVHDKRLEAAFLAVFRGQADNDGFNRLVVAAGADWREAAVLRAYAAFLRQLGSPFGPRYLADTLHAACRCRRAICSSCFTCASIPARKLDIRARQAAEDPDPAAHRGRAFRSPEPRRGPHSAAVPQPDRRYGAHQLLPGRRGRAAAGDHCLQVRQQRGGRGAAAATVPRDLGLLAARRRRAPALRADRARRHPLVRPGAGFPHRGVGARPCPAGQECRDRAGPAPRAASCPSSCRARARATKCRRKASPPTASSSPRCSTSPTT